MTRATQNDRSGRPRRRSATGWLVIGLTVLAACGEDGGDDSASGRPNGPDPSPIAELAVEDEPGVAPDGQELLDGRLEDAPHYELTATVDPETGAVDGTVQADVPAGDAAEAHLRYFPALVNREAAEITRASVDGSSVDYELDASLLTLPLPDAHEDWVRLEVDFNYEAPEFTDPGMLGSLGSLTGEDEGGLQPSDIGLLARSEDVVTMGHWFPIWIPDGLTATPDPQGFGDIGNFPAAVIQADITAPEGWTVVSGGTTVSPDSGSTIEAGVGLRDLGVVLVRDATIHEDESSGTLVRVVAPSASGPDDQTLTEVAEETATSVEVLSDTFGPYPWTELDVVATPLGSGVGGMEWPGAIWIESNIFAGGLPGMGDLGDLGSLGDLGMGDLGSLEDMLGDLSEEDMEMLNDLLGSILGGEGDVGDLGDLGLGDLGAGDAGPDDDGLGGNLGSAFDPAVLGAIRPWTVAHEVGHQWWHAMVGNDSMDSPIVDEPLAQYSACVVFKDAWPTDADTICEANTAGAYQQMRMMGVEDAPADQPSDAFESSLQYSGVVYGKAPVMYYEMAEQYGEPELNQALADVVEEHAFLQTNGDGLRDSLGSSLGDPAAVDAQWERWINEAHGDEDLQ